jgi:hypothetical protein
MKRLIVTTAFVLVGFGPFSCLQKRFADMSGDSAVAGTPTSYEFSLHCNPHRGANHLAVAWGAGTGFELVRVTDAVCRDDADVDPGWPPTNFDTFHAAGTGLLGGEEGARATWLRA